MQTDWYKKHGFELSALVDQAAVDRAEADVKRAYIAPILGDDAQGEEVDMAVGNLAFLLILQRSIVATRAGAKVKATQSSQSAEIWSIIAQEALSCHQRLEVLRDMPNARRTAKIYDVCKIYFKSNFISV